jgi:hypothetical protein
MRKDGPQKPSRKEQTNNVIDVIGSFNIVVGGNMSFGT